MKIILFLICFTFCIFNAEAFRYKSKVKIRHRFRKSSGRNFLRNRLKNRNSEKDPSYEELLAEYTRLPGAYFILQEPYGIKPTYFKGKLEISVYGLVVTPMDNFLQENSILDRSIIFTQTVTECIRVSNEEYYKAFKILTGKPSDYKIDSAKSKERIDKDYAKDELNIISTYPKNAFLIPFKYIENCDSLRLINSKSGKDFIPIEFPVESLTTNDRLLYEYKINSKPKPKENKNKGGLSSNEEFPKSITVNAYYQYNIIQFDSYSNIDCKHPQDVGYPTFNLKIIHNPVLDAIFSDDSSAFSKSKNENEAISCKSNREFYSNLLKEYGAAMTNIFDIFQQELEIYKVKSLISYNSKLFFANFEQFSTFFTSSGISSPQLIIIKDVVRELTDRTSSWDSLDVNIEHKIYDSTSKVQDGYTRYFESLVKQMDRQINEIPCILIGGYNSKCEIAK